MRNRLFLSYKLNHCSDLLEKESIKTTTVSKKVFLILIVHLNLFRLLGNDFIQSTNVHHLETVEQFKTIPPL